MYLTNTGHGQKTRQEVPRGRPEHIAATPTPALTPLGVSCNFTLLSARRRGAGFPNENELIPHDSGFSSMSES